jgi:hypothetical protein
MIGRRGEVKGIRNAGDQSGSKIIALDVACVTAAKKKPAGTGTTQRGEFVL